MMNGLRRRGDSLRAVLTAPVPLPQPDRAAFRRAARHRAGASPVCGRPPQHPEGGRRPTLEAASTAVQYDVTADPQIVLTLQGPTTLRSSPTSRARTEDRAGARTSRARPRRGPLRTLRRTGRDTGHRDATSAWRSTSRRGTSSPPTSPTSSGRATSITPRPVRASSSTPYPYEGLRLADGRGASGRPQPVRGPHPGPPKGDPRRGTATPSSCI